MSAREITQALTAPWRHGEHADLRGGRVNAPLDLSGRTLRSFDLSDAKFAETVTARGAVLRGMSWFHRAVFDQPLDLRGTVIRHDLRMDGVTAASLNLFGARLEGVLCLDGATIDVLDLREAILLANLSLAGATIGTIRLNGTELLGGVWAKHARMPVADFSGAQIEGRFEEIRPGNSFTKSLAQSALKKGVFSHY